MEKNDQLLLLNAIYLSQRPDKVLKRARANYFNEIQNNQSELLMTDYEDLKPKNDPVLQKSYDDWREEQLRIYNKKHGINTGDSS